MNPIAGIHAEVTAKRAQRNGIVATILTLFIPLVSIWAVIEGNKLRECGRNQAGMAIIVTALTIAVLRVALYVATV